MRVLIADDEKIECIALEKMLRELFPALEVLPGVHDGVELLQAAETQRPDIVIVDIHMPKLNGLEALEVLRMKHCEMEIIIHTAFDEFAYLHRALQMGACEFLVKPVTEELLVQVMCRAIEAVRKKSAKPVTRQTPDISAEMLTVINNSIMMSLILQAPDAESYQIWKSLYQTGSGAGLLVCLGAEQGLLPVKLTEELIRTADGHCICLHYLHAQQLYLYLFTEGVTDARGYLSWIGSWLGRRITDLSAQYHCELKCGVSGYKQSFEDMTEAVSEAELAKSAAKDRVVNYYHQEAKKRKKLPVFEKEGAWAARLLSEEGAGRAADGLYDKLKRDTADTAPYVSLRYGLFLAELFREIACSLQLDQRKTGMRWSVQERTREILLLFGAGAESEAETSGAVLFLERRVVEDYILRVLKQMEEDLKRPLIMPARAVETALQYIQKNYARDISLEETAAQAGVTRFYLGRLLKQERNQTFMEILTDVRLGKALQYIEEGVATNQNISTLVGYNTVEYFQQVFKRKLGLSPGEYRRILEQGTK